MKTLDIVPRPIRAHLIGKAAVCLLSFHLARRGIDFAITTDSASCGDMWADLGEGVVAIEVKSSTDTRWHVRPTQAKHKGLWAFVCISDTRCWLVRDDAVEAAFNRYGTGDYKTTILTLSQVEAMGGIPLHTGLPVLLAPRKSAWSVKPRAPRKVTRTLASGEVKEYVYGGAQST
jgi:hypothetical protein